MIDGNYERPFHERDRPTFSRKRPASTVRRLSPGVRLHSHLWHRPLLQRAQDVHRHLQGRNDLQVLCREGHVPAVAISSSAKNRNPRPHPPSLLSRYHLYNSRQLLCHDQAGHRVSTSSTNKRAVPFWHLVRPDRTLHYFWASKFADPRF